MENHYPAWIYRKSQVDIRKLPLLSIVTLMDVEYKRPFKSSYVLFPSAAKVAATISSLRERLVAAKKLELDEYWEVKQSR